MIEGKSFSEIFSSPERWTQGRAWSDGNKTVTKEEATSCCLVGACSILESNLELQPLTANDIIYKVLSGLQEPHDGPMAGYNDDPSRTFEDIQRIAKRADEILREKGIIK